MSKRLFVAMPYRQRTAPLDYEDSETTCTIDFDAVWKGVLQPAVPQGFDTKRADELRRPGLIDRLYNEWLYGADVVLADLTFGNANVYYELGIRQALSKRGTVLVACKGTRLPFDVRNQYVIQYDYFAAPGLPEFQAELRQTIDQVATQELDSPVHVFLPGLHVARYPDGKSPATEVAALEARVRDLEAELANRSSGDDESRFLAKVRAANVTVP